MSKSLSVEADVQFQIRIIVFFDLGWILARLGRPRILLEANRQIIFFLDVEQRPVVAELLAGLGMRHFDDHALQFRFTDLAFGKYRTAVSPNFMSPCH